MLSFMWGGVCYFVEEVCGVFWYRYVDKIVFLVPIDCQAAIIATLPIGCDGILFAENIQEMVCILFVIILDTEVVHA